MLSNVILGYSYEDCRWLWQCFAVFFSSKRSSQDQGLKNHLFNLNVPFPVSPGSIWWNLRVAAWSCWTSCGSRPAGQLSQPTKESTTPILIVSQSGLRAYRDYTVRGLSNVWRLRKYWSPVPPGECVPPPPPPPPGFGAGGGRTRWVERGGGSIVRKTPDTSLYSIYVSTLWLRVCIRIRYRHLFQNQDSKLLPSPFFLPKYFIYRVA